MSDLKLPDEVARLRATFATGRTRPLAWRDAQLAALDRLMTEREDELTAALVADLRRTPFEAMLFDLAATKPEVRHARKHLRAWMRPRKVRAPLAVRPGKAWFRYEPAGVVLIVGAWNYPVHLTLAPLVGALAAGNCVVVKPSEIAPATSRALADLLPRYLDPDAVTVVEGDAETTQELLAQGFDHCFFTGSPAVGASVMAAAAPHLTPVTLELGGKCPAIVTRSARLDVVARRIAAAKLTNYGQTCVAPDYVLVEEQVKGDLVRLLCSALDAFSEGKGVPVVNGRHATRISRLIETAGGRTVLGGSVDLDNAIVSPTVIVDPKADSPIMSEEIFGPVLPVVGVSGLDDAIAHVRRGGRPLAGYLFTEDAADEDRVLTMIDTGGLVVNHAMLHLAVNDLPFGGTGTSGNGRYHGHWGFETFSYAKAVLRKSTSVDPKIGYPPYSPLVQRILRKLV